MTNCIEAIRRRRCKILIRCSRIDRFAEKVISRPQLALRKHPSVRPHGLTTSLRPCVRAHKSGRKCNGMESKQRKRREKQENSNCSNISRQTYRSNPMRPNCHNRSREEACNDNDLRSIISIATWPDRFVFSAGARYSRTRTTKLSRQTSRRMRTAKADDAAHEMYVN